MTFSKLSHLVYKKEKHVIVFMSLRKAPALTNIIVQKHAHIPKQKGKPHITDSASRQSYIKRSLFSTTYSQFCIKGAVSPTSLTPLLLGISPKLPFEASRAVFWSLSDYKEQKLPRILFKGRELCGLLFQMQNISFLIRECAESKLSRLKSDPTVSNRSQNPTKNITIECRINPLALKQRPPIPNSSNRNSNLIDQKCHLILIFIIWPNVRAGKMKRILCSDWYPSEQDEAILPARDFPHWSRKIKFSLLAI